MKTLNRAIRSATAQWLKDQMFEHKVAGNELVAAMQDAGLKATGQLISNFRREGMSIQKAEEIAGVMGWKAPSLSEIDFTSSLKGISDITRSRNHKSQDTLTLTSDPGERSGETVAKGTVVRMEVLIDWLRKTFPAVEQLDKLSLGFPIDAAMGGTFQPDDVLIADTQVRSFGADGIYAFSVDDKLFIKRIQAIPGRGYLVISDDKEHYEPFMLEADVLERTEVQAQILGKWNFVKF